VSAGPAEACDGTRGRTRALPAACLHLLAAPAERRCLLGRSKGFAERCRQSARCLLLQVRRPRRPRRRLLGRQACVDAKQRQMDARPTDGLAC